jgi:triphosphoribosyl-dephospho-CoA synthetase
MSRAEAPGNAKKLEAKVRINTTIQGDPARELLELKKRGIFTSNRDAVVQSIRLFYERVVERDLKQQRATALAGEPD